MTDTNIKGRLEISRREIEATESLIERLEGLTAIVESNGGDSSPDRRLLGRHREFLRRRRDRWKRLLSEIQQTG